MAWNRKHRRIAELTEQLAAALGCAEDAAACAEDAVAVAQKRTEDVAFAERVAVQAVERRDTLLHRVGDRMAARLPECAAEWEAAKAGVAWRDERGRFLPRGDR